MARQGKYIYGFINSTGAMSLDLQGIDEKEVNLFHYEDIAAVVSTCNYEPFDSFPRETVLRNLAVYQAVIERIMKGYHIIPVKFGTMVEGEQELRRALTEGYSQIKASLKKMANKIELDVAALWSDLETTLKKIGDEKEIKTLKEEAASGTPDAVFELKIRVGKLVKELLEKRRAECASLILDVLKRESEDHRDHPIMDDSMIMNTAFLIQKDREEIFEGRVEQLDRHYQDIINFRIVGPLPPYSFRTFEIAKVDFREVNQAREVMGLGKESTPMEIKETYWKLARKFHPDKFPGDLEAQKRFESISKAYQVLRDYCQGERCSFGEADIKGWVGVRPVEQPGAG